MVIGLANKSSSGSTCVLVRRRTRDPVLGRDRVVTHSPHLLFLVFQVLLFSFCLLLIPAMYSSDTRGSVPAEYVGKRLKDTFKAWAVVKGFFCVVS